MEFPFGNLNAYKKTPSDSAAPNDIVRRRQNVEKDQMKMNPSVILVTLLALGAVQQASAGLVAHYELNGNAVDSIGGGGNGTIIGSLTPVADRFGNPNGALAFNKNGYIDLPNTTLLNGATQAAITGWVKNRLLPGEDGFVISADDPRPGLAPFTVRFTGTELSEALFGDTLKGPFASDRAVGFEGGSGIFVQQDTWFSFVSQFSSVGNQTTYQLYINGQLVRQENYARSAQVAYDQPMPVEIGALEGYFYPSTQFRGDIDDLRFYNTVLTPEDIAAISAVPEPSTALFGVLCSLAIVSHRKKRRAIAFRD